jgi:hypothetical protein
MNDLLKVMAEDLSISAYAGESEEEFCYRVCYSALAYWLLYTGKGIENGRPGVSKKTQTETIQVLLLQYGKLLGLEPSYFSEGIDTFCQHARKVYEETGYLTVDKRNYSIIANYGRSIQTDAGYLFFGCPDKLLRVCGLGMFTDTAGYEVGLFDTMLRDTLSVDEYIASMFNPLDFEERDIELADLEFFNPSLRKAPSSSWGKTLVTKRALSRTMNRSVYFRVIKEEGDGLLFAEEPLDSDKERLVSFDTRRLYIALKAKYGAPVIAWVNRLDERFFEIRLSAQLPTREYYFLLFFAWPKGGAFDKTRFIADLDMLPTIEKVLKNIGVEVWRNKNA